MMYIATNSQIKDEGTTNTKWLCIRGITISCWVMLPTNVHQSEDLTFLRFLYVWYQELYTVGKYYQTLWAIHKGCCWFYWITVPLQKKKKEAMTKLNSEVSPGISKHFIIFRQLAAIMQMHVVHQLHWCWWCNYKYLHSEELLDLRKFAINNPWK